MVDRFSLLKFPATELLEQFGSGKPIPGSGCAAALLAILASHLIMSLAKLTLEKKGESVRHEANQVVLLTTKANSRLEVLFDRDADIFGEVVQLRKQRDAETRNDQKLKLNKQSIEKLAEATEILFDIAEADAIIAECGNNFKNLPYKAALGECATGINSALASIRSCIQIIELNLKRNSTSDLEYRLGELSEKFESIKVLSA